MLQILAKTAKFLGMPGKRAPATSLQSLAAAHDKERLATSLPKGMDHVVVDLAVRFVNRSAILHRHRVEPSCRLASSHCSLSQSGPSHFDAEACKIMKQIMLI